MEAGQMRILLDLSACLPLAVLGLPLVLLLLNLSVGRIPGVKKLIPELNLKWFFILFAVGVFGALFGIHYAALPYGEPGQAAEVSVWERIVTTLLRTVKNFGLDENFDQLTQRARNMVGCLQWERTGTIRRFEIWAGVLYILAPILGGVGLLQILSGIFHGFRHWLLGLAFWKEKYYFSLLSDESLALAESISGVKSKFGRKPVLIFTGAEAAESDPEAAKRLSAAKDIGAICLKKDLQFVKVHRFGKRKFFLMGQEDQQALQQLIALTEAKRHGALIKSEVFLFVKGDAYVQVEKNLRDKLVEQLGIKEEKFPVILPVRCDFNLISNLLVEIPLFEPLLGREKPAEGKQELVLSILGAGVLGREMFLAAYWIGQILDHTLRIHVYSKEEEADFWAQIDRVNPEIRNTVTKGHDCLLINERGEKADPYAQVEYFQCDLLSFRFTHDPEKGDTLPVTDYYFIALGSDRENIAMADQVRRYVGQEHLNRKDGKKTVITYVVWDQQLADTLNFKKHFSFAGEKTDVYMRAVGSFRELYSIRNVFMLNYDQYAQQTFDAHEALNNRENRKAIQQNRRKEEYKYWANLARVMHIGYKLYSMDGVKTSVFDMESEEEFQKKRREEYRIGKDILCGILPADYSRTRQQHQQLLHRLAWLEHRRWNAFTRVRGYRSTTLYETYRKWTGSHKQMELKLHPCLVECDQLGAKSPLSDKGVPNPETRAKTQLDPDYDKLDTLTYEFNRLGLIDYDLKYYDYPFESVK